MNSTIKPFDNLNVRKAVVAASDRKALQLTRGGTAAGDLATHFLPVDFPGFEEAGGAKGPSLDFMANPSGDMALAKKYMLAAKKEDPSLPIDADGKWTDSDQLLMVASNADPGKKTAEVAQAQFEKLGFKIRFRAVPQDTLYTKFCNVPGAEDRDLPERRLVQGLQRPAGGARRGVQRQEHPAARTTPTGRSSTSPPSTTRWRRPRCCPPAPSATRRGARSTTWSPRRRRAIPYLWDKIPTVEAPDVRGVVNQYSTSWDLTSPP